VAGMNDSALPCAMKFAGSYHDLSSRPVANL